MKKREDKPLDELSNLLREWQVKEVLPPEFQASVWRRIDSSVTKEGDSLLKTLISWFNQAVSRPQRAAAYIVFFAVIGMTFGWAQGQREMARVQEGLAKRYVQTLNPYQK